MVRRKGRNAKQLPLNNKKESHPVPVKKSENLDDFHSKNTEEEDGDSGASNSIEGGNEVSIDADPDYVSIINEYLQQLNRNSVDESESTSQEDIGFSLESKPCISISSITATTHKMPSLGPGSFHMPGDFLAGSAPQPTLKEQFCSRMNMPDDFDHFTETFRQASSLHSDSGNRFRHRSDEPCGTTMPMRALDSNYEMDYDNFPIPFSYKHTPSYGVPNSSSTGYSSISSQGCGPTQINCAVSVDKSLSSGSDSAYWTSRNSLVVTPLSMLRETATNSSALPPCNESYEQQTNGLMMRDEEELEYLMHYPQNGGGGNYVDIPSSGQISLPYMSPTSGPEVDNGRFLHSLSVDSGCVMKTSFPTHRNGAFPPNNNGPNHSSDYFWQTMLDSTPPPSTAFNTNSSSMTLNRERTASGHKLQYPNRHGGKYSTSKLFNSVHVNNNRKLCVSEEMKSHSRQMQVVDKSNRACSFFLRGHCKKEDCQFAHDLRNVVCRFWAESECYKGEFCPFRHSPLCDNPDDCDVLVDK